MHPLITDLSPAQLEELLDFHFNLLFTQNNSVVIRKQGYSCEFLRCAVSEKGWGILIELNSTSSPFTRSRNNTPRLVRGNIRMEEINISIDGKERQFISIYCRRAGLLRLFTRLMGDILWHLLADGPRGGDPWAFITDRLSGWKLLFSGPDSKAQEKGLLGELLVLKHLMDTYEIPVTVWTGPLGGVKDFRLAERNIEVKTTSVRYGYLIEINGLFQAEVQQIPENLVFIRIEETPNGRFTVRDLIADIQRNCTGEMGDELQVRLQDFSDDVLDSSNRWDVLQAVVLDINSRFPRISRENFTGRKLPEGIVNITWTADLAALEKTTLTEFNF